MCGGAKAGARVHALYVRERMWKWRTEVKLAIASTVEVQLRAGGGGRARVHTVHGLSPKLSRQASEEFFVLLSGWRLGDEDGRGGGQRGSG